MEMAYLWHFMILWLMWATALAIIHEFYFLFDIIFGIYHEPYSPFQWTVVPNGRISQTMLEIIVSLTIFLPQFGNLHTTSKETLNSNTGDRHCNLRNGNRSLFKHSPTPRRQAALAQTSTVKVKELLHSSRPAHCVVGERVWECVWGFCSDRAPMRAHWDDLITESDRNSSPSPPRHTNTHAHTQTENKQLNHAFRWESHADDPRRYEHTKLPIFPLS